MKNFNKRSVIINAYKAPSPSAVCIHSDAVYFISDEILYKSVKDTCIKLCFLSEIFTENNREVSPIVLIDYCSENSSLGIVYESGDLLTVNSNDGNASYVGCMETGVTAARWSPGEDILAIVTNKLSVVLLTTDYEPLTETDLLGSDEEKQVSVGWGRKETQFRGTEGKLKPGAQPIELPNSADDGKTRISWRGDCEYLVISLHCNDLRVMKILSRDGVLLHTSETCPGLESALSWRPSGNLIASSQQLPNKHVICFFEKNGLRHGDFQLHNKVIVRELFWNFDSTILSGILQFADGQVAIHHFTVSNYCWYQKSFIAISPDDELVVAEWDKLDSSLLHVVTGNGKEVKHLRYSYSWNVSSSSGFSNDDSGSVLVINGNELSLTQFKKAVIPPPMCAQKFSFNGKQILFAGFKQYGVENCEYFHDINDFYFVTEDNQLIIHAFDAKKACYNLIGFGAIQDGDVFELSWVDKTTWLCLVMKDNAIFLRSIALDNVEGQSLSFKIKDTVVDEPIIIIRRVPNTSQALLVTNTLKYMQYNLDDGKISQWLNPIPKEAKSPICLELRQTETKGLVSFLLDSSHKLFQNDALLLNGVTSVRLHDDMLLATTMQHKLLCWFINGEISTANAMERPIERGAKIVTCISGTSKVILQMPRGNLELILPRALSLEKLKKDIASLKYADAYETMRRERINLNLFHDHDPEKFIQNIDHFLKEVQAPALLYTFIADLIEENVTKTTYAAYYDVSKRKEVVSNKIESICSAILGAIQSKENRNELLLPELTCLVKQRKIEEALLIVKGIRNLEMNGAKCPVSSAEGLRHIMYFIDIEQLFKYALGTYDFDLVKFIASKSQKDPREYIPFISSLQEMEESYQKFTIDKFLKRYEKALKHLVNCEDRLSECLTFIESRKLHSEALKLFSNQSKGYKAVCSSFGNLLTQQRRDNEAGVMYSRANDLNLALFSFNRAANWRQVIYCATKLNYSTKKMLDLLESLSSSLMDEKKYEDAAKLLVEHLGDVSAGVVAMCQGAQFGEACRLARLYGCEDLIEEKIKPLAIAHATSTTQSIDRDCAKFQQQSTRLFKVLKDRQESGDQVDWDDTSSESSRGSSRSSAYSTRSAKNSRKLERKLLSLKEGGPYEDVALTASLYDLITHVVGLKREVNELNTILLCLNEEAVAASLQASLSTCLKTIASDISKIWTHPNNKFATGGPNATSNSLAAALTSPEKLNLPPAVQAMQPKVLFPPDMHTGIEWEISILK